MRKSIAKTFVSIALSLPLAQFAFAAPVSYGGGDGGTIETAIIVKGAVNEEEGVLAENTYIAKLHPDWRSIRTALVSKSGRYYDTNSYISKDGSQRTLIFDITEFFGKM